MKAVEIVLGKATKVFQLREHTFKTGNSGYICRDVMYDDNGQGFAVLIRLAKFKPKKE